jgi:hypothetical protein
MSHRLLNLMPIVLPKLPVVLGIDGEVSRRRPLCAGSITFVPTNPDAFPIEVHPRRTLQEAKLREA